MSIGIILAGGVTLVFLGALVSLWARQRRTVSSYTGGEAGYYSSPDTASGGSWEADSCGDGGSADGGGDCGGGDGGGGGE
jgi:hypothetical protein